MEIKNKKNFAAKNQEFNVWAKPYARRSDIKKTSRGQTLYRLKDLPVQNGIFWYCDNKKSYFPLYKILPQVIENGNFQSITNLFARFSYKELRKAWTKAKPVFSQKNDIGYDALSELVGVLLAAKKKTEATITNKKIKYGKHNLDGRD